MNFKENLIRKCRFQLSALTKLKKNFKDQSLEALSAAIFLNATRMLKLGVIAEDVANYSQVPVQDIERAKKFIEKGYEPEQLLNSGNPVEGAPVTGHAKIDFVTSDPQPLCRNFGNKLGLDKEMLALSQQILLLIKEKRLLDGKPPSTIAAVAI